jgi:hypothetical protein
MCATIYDAELRRGTPQKLGSPPDKAEGDK